MAGATHDREAAALFRCASRDSALVLAEVRHGGGEPGQTGRLFQ